jgi:hypothetical protein
LCRDNEAKTHYIEEDDQEYFESWGLWSFSHASLVCEGTRLVP